MIDFSCKHDIWLEAEDGSLQRMDEPFFRSWKIAPGTWQILSDGAFSYLVEGDEEAILIDSGYGAGNIREYAQSLTEKPLSKICNTHDHFDHTANNSYFDLAYMSAQTYPLATIKRSGNRGSASFRPGWTRWQLLQLLDGTFGKSGNCLPFPSAPGRSPAVSCRRNPDAETCTPGQCTERAAPCRSGGFLEEAGTAHDVGRAIAPGEWIRGAEQTGDDCGSRDG